MSKFEKFVHLADRVLNPLNKIEVFGMYGPGNLGDEAMLVAALMHLPRHCCSSYRTFFARPDVRFLLRHRPIRHLLVGGGTLIHGGNTGWLDYIEMRAHQNVRLSFLGTGLAFLDEQIELRSDAFKRWCEVLQGSHDIFLRGPRSAELAQLMCGRGEVFGDFAFLLHNDELVLDHHSGRTAEVGINLGDCLGDQNDLEAKFVPIITHLSKDFTIVFHAVCAGDVAVIDRVIQRSGLPAERFRIESDFFDPLQFMAKIRKYRAFIGVKMHAAGLAMVCGVPTVMISYLPKCHDFVGPLSMGNNVLLDLPLDREVAMAKIMRLLEEPDLFTCAAEIGQIANRQRTTLRRVFALDQ